MSLRLPRFTILQLLLGAALCALVLGLFTSSWRSTAYSSITAIAFSPSGKTLAARYSGGGFQAWNVDRSPPRLVAQTPSGQMWAGDWGLPVRFADDQTLIDIRSDYSGGAPQSEVRAVDLGNSHIRPVMSLPNIAWGPPYAATGNWLAVANHATGTIDCYDLAQRRLVRSVKGVVYSHYGLDLTPDGSRLVFIDQNNNLQVVEVATGKVVKSTSGAGISTAELTRDGRWLAASDWSVKPVEIHDLATNDPPRPLATQVDVPQWLAFTADGKRLAVAGVDAVEVYDVASQERVGRIVLSDTPRGLSLLPSKRFSLGWQQLALSPDGDTLATFEGGQIALWDVASGKVRTVITGGLRNLQIAIFTVGFALWSAAWGIVARRERLKRPQRDLPLSSYMPRMPATRPPPKVANAKRTLVQMLCWVAVLVLIVYLLVNWDSIMAEGLLALAPALLWLAGVVVGLIALLLAYVWLMGRLRGPSYWQIVHLRTLTGDPGRQQRHGPITAWFVGVSSIEPVFARECDAMAARLSEVLAEPVSFNQPFTLLGLDRQCDLDALFQRHVPAAGIVSKDRRPPTVVVCEQTAVENLQAPVDQLRGALVLALVTELRGGFVPAWVAATISFHATRNADTSHALRSAARRLKLKLARQGDWTPLPLLALGDEEVAKLRLAADRPLEGRQALLLSDVCTTLGEFLLGEDAPAERRERTIAWLRAARPKDDAVATFETHLESPLSDVLAQWRAWIRAYDTTRHDPPPFEKLACLRHFTLLKIRDKRFPLAERLRAIRVFSAAGYVTGADTLIGLFADPACSCKAELVEALEEVSGLMLGDDPAAWHGWWESLPLAVRRPEEARPADPLPGGEPVTASIVTDPRPAVPGLPLPRRVLPPKLAVPTELKVCWGLMLVGGLVALAIPISVLFLNGPVVWPAMYFGLVVGVLAIARGAARDTVGLSRVAAFQMANIIACDPVNFVLGMVVQQLLKRPHVEKYLFEEQMRRTAQV